MAKNKNDGKRRQRKGETLFIDARKLGLLVDRIHRELTATDVEKVSQTYHSWRGDKGKPKYIDVAGFCRSVPVTELAAHGYVLSPGRYVGSGDIDEDGEPFEQKMRRLVSELQTNFKQSNKIEQLIRKNLEELGYGE